MAIHFLASVHPLASVGERLTVWQWSQVRERAILGDDVSIGQGAYIGPGTQIGSRCRIQNNALIYEPAVLEEGVFIGPGVVTTNDHNPRAVNPDLTPKRSGQWKEVGVYIEQGASIGAGAILVAPLKIGKWAAVGAGSVVLSDVPDFALVVGSPARQIGWVGEYGVRLNSDGGDWVCPVTKSKYKLTDGALRRRL